MPVARGGSLDAALVAVSGLTVEDTTRLGPNDLVLHTSYGATNVDVLVHQDGSFDFDAYPELSTIDVVGILVPASAGGPWRLLPRSVEDITIAP
mgnify:FL=1